MDQKQSTGMPDDQSHPTAAADDREAVAEGDTVARFYEAKPNPPPLAAKANDLEAIRDTVVDAAGISIGLWLSYLFVLFYLLVAAGGVTHRDLFFETPVKPPFLDVALPLQGFFALGPVLFLIVHAYVLLHFVMLANKVGVFDQALRAQIDDADIRTQLRRQLPSNIFVQFLAGPREVRNGLVGFLLRLIALISLVIGPIALLVFFQLQFLPYHEEWITWWHRAAVILDLVLIWRLWPMVGLCKSVPVESGSARRRNWMELIQRISTVTAMRRISVASLIMLVFVIATFPGELLQERILRRFQSIPLLQSIPLRTMLVAGKVDMATRKPKSVWSNRLVLPGLDVIDHTRLDTEEKIRALPETVSLRARHLEGAFLIGARLRKVDLTAAYLQEAQLREADLRQAKLECGVVDRGERESRSECAQLQKASLDDAQLKDAFIYGSQLKEASLINTQLKGASLYGAQLEGANLRDAHLHGASLQFAQLQGANLRDAQLHGASLVHAHLQGAELRGTHLQRADIRDARLQGVSLQFAHLQAADLRDAQLQGASILHVQLQGALLDGAQLQGAELTGAQLQAVSMKYAITWRADPRKADLTNAWTEGIKSDRLVRYNDQRDDCCWISQTFQTLWDEITEQVTSEPARKRALDRIDARLRRDPDNPLDGEDMMAAEWRKKNTPRDAYEAEVFEYWRKAGCASDGAPYVASRLTTRMAFPIPYPFKDKDSRSLAKLAASFLEETCGGAKGLSQDEVKRLRDLAAPQATVTSVP